MKTKITLLIGCLLAGIFTLSDLQAMNFTRDSLVTDSLGDEELHALEKRTTQVARLELA